MKDTILKLLKNSGHCTVAIDGRCAAGKTTLAEKIAKELDCNVFHMDDFFLRPEQRTPERLAEAGGNIDYERFLEEVLVPLSKGLPFSYRPYDCRNQVLSLPIQVEPKAINIIEGSYSLHPHFERYYDLKILLEIDTATQRKRLSRRNPALYDRFLTEWIPMEEQYFNETKIAERCDIKETYHEYSFKNSKQSPRIR